MLSNSEASPRIWTCVTRPSRVHVCRVWARDYHSVKSAHGTVLQRYMFPREMCAPEHISLYSDICSPGTDITSIIGTLPTVIRAFPRVKCFPTNFNVHGNNLISDSTYRIQQAKGNIVSITKYNHWTHSDVRTTNKINLTKPVCFIFI